MSSSTYPGNTSNTAPSYDYDAGVESIPQAQVYYGTTTSSSSSSSSSGSSSGGTEILERKQDEYNGVVDGVEFNVAEYSAPMPPSENYNPTKESDWTLDVSEGEITSTNIPYDGDFYSITHINFFDNNIKKISGLDRFPNLMRLTLRHNCLTQLKGVNEAPNLRWLDCSSNDIKSFKKMGDMPNLEWLDCHYNYLSDLKGIGHAPNITFLNANDNTLTSLTGIDALQNLKYIDLSDNDLPHARELHKARLLQEIDLSKNYLTDVKSILRLSELPYLFKLDLHENDFSKKQRQTIQEHFAQQKPECRVRV
eukprot:TRINITY_DN1487_c2_g1_i1.p1 TRINITY_DN1487_c2_g1~~TRINITY_DN1487_c2_g1_i1.p1  ORF type:complete len:309 (-),score=106.39 TRINITY_DN1487_c2_g1_i1:54-980(-)